MKALKSILAVAALASGMTVAAASPAAAACAVYPGTNEITIRIGSGDPLTSIQPTPSGLVGICVDVIGGPNLVIDEEVTVDFPEGCGNCFVLAWDGVSWGAGIVRITVIVDNQSTTIEHPIGGNNDGSFCINSGTPCP